jgi:surfeit locus 1 family protein
MSADGPWRAGPPSRARFPVALTVVVLVCELILIGLGAWQLQRLRWKTGVLERIHALRSAPAAPVEPFLIRQSAGEDVAYAHVRAVCRGIDAAPYVQVYALREGQPGVRLVSACRLVAGPYRSLLVDRGFVAEGVSARPPISPGARDPIVVSGVLRRPDPRGAFTPANTAALWYWRDTEGIAAALQADRPAPLFLAAETSTNPAWRALVPAPLPEDIPNNHLAYALTWFGLAAALAGVYLARLFTRGAGR